MGKQWTRAFMAKLTPRARGLMVLQMMQRRGGNPSFERAMSELDDGIRASSKIWVEASKSKSEEYREVVGEREGEFIEAMAGIAFVLGQAFVASIVASVESLNKINKTEKPADPLPFPTLPIKPKEIRKFAAQPIGMTQITLPEAVHEFANYFKHKDGWQYKKSTVGKGVMYEWDDGIKQQKPTIDVLRAFNLSSGPDILSDGLERMGYGDCDIVSLASDLTRWYKCVHHKCKKAVVSIALNAK
jgi:hypothetical protein